MAPLPSSDPPRHQSLLMGREPLPDQSQDQDQDPDPDPLSLAWRRSTLCGLTPQNARPGAPDPRASRSRRLSEAARPVMDGLDAVLRDTGAMLLLADREGRVIRTVRDEARISRMLLRRGVDDGATLTEDAVGNNGIGTALETRAGVFIHGDQHFAEILRDFSCYGHPIVDPLTRRLVGALDLTGMSADASRMFAPFVRKIVADIEARYVDTARADDRELWHRFLERTRGSDATTCAFGDEVVLASHSSLERLASHDIATLRRMVERDEVADTVELSMGTVGVLSSRVGRRGRLLDLSFPDLSPPADTSRARHSASTSSADTNRSGLSGEVPPGTAGVAAGVAAGTHAVVGPSGSGRTTTATAVAGTGSLRIRLAEADDAEQAWARMVVPALHAERRSDGRSLILDDIDLLADADLRRLAARLASGKVGVVVVTSLDDPRPAVTRVLDACDARTTVRPLHERGAESGEIVRRMVSNLASARGMGEPAITARFVEAACALDLSNGLMSLRSILAECLDHADARVGATPVTLDVNSLPVRARSSRPPRSGELARGEYDAIVAALADCDGVRSRAARRLGISRTTLYARMREFGLS